MGYYETHGSEFSFKGVKYVVSGLRSVSGDGGGDRMRVERVDGQPIAGAKDTGDGTTVGLPRALELAAETALTRKSNYRAK